MTGTTRRSRVRPRIADFHRHADVLIAMLPANDSMRWVYHPAANPSQALVIGAKDGRDILAFMVSAGGSRPMVKYCLNPPDRRLSGAVPHLSPVEVMKSQLNTPFGYNADIRRGESNFTNVIRWYFMVKFNCMGDFEYEKYCEGLYSALKIIEAKKHAEKETERPGQEEAYTARQLEGESASITESDIQWTLLKDTQLSQSSPNASAPASL